MYDYEKFCQLLSVAAVKSTSIGKVGISLHRFSPIGIVLFMILTLSTFQIQAEKVFARFLEAVVNSSSNGRSFLFLCSLVDRKMSGHLSKVPP